MTVLHPDMSEIPEKIDYAYFYISIEKYNFARKFKVKDNKYKYIYDNRYD